MKKFVFGLLASLSLFGSAIADTGRAYLIPPVAIVYPASVVTAGLQTTYDTMYYAGRNLSLTCTPITPGCTLPSGTTIVGDVIQIGASGTLTGWDFTGYSVKLDGTKTLTCNNCKFKNPNGSTNLVNIATAGATPTTNTVFNCYNCEFDGQSSKNGSSLYDGMVKSYGTLNLQYVWMHDAPTNNINFLGLSFSLADSYLNCSGKIGAGAPYVAYPGNQHVDNIHYFNGTGTITRVFFDNYDGIATGIRGSWTSSYVYNQAFTGTTNLTITSSIMRGGATILGDASNPAFLGSTYAYDMAPNNGLGYTATTTFTGNVLDTGRTGKYSQATVTNTTLVSSGNLNYTTGAAATLPSGP